MPEHEQVEIPLIDVHRQPIPTELRLEQERVVYLDRLITAEVEKHAVPFSVEHREHEKVLARLAEILLHRVRAAKREPQITRIGNDWHRIVNYSQASTSFISALPSGSGLSSANLRARSTAALASSSIASKSLSTRTPVSFRLSLKSTIGSRS